MLSGYFNQTVRDAPLSAAVRLSIILAAFKALVVNEKHKFLIWNLKKKKKNITQNTKSFKKYRPLPKRIISIKHTKVSQKKKAKIIESDICTDKEMEKLFLEVVQFLGRTHYLQ